MFNLFNLRRRAATRQLARELTIYDRRTHEYPGTPPGPLPYAVYDQMQRDSMVQTVMSVKKQGVLAAKYSVVPAADTPAARRNADFVEESFAHMDGSPATILSQAMDAFAKGWSVQELVFEPSGDRIALKAVKSKDPARFGLELDAFGNVTGLRLEASLRGGEEERRSGGVSSVSPPLPVSSPPSLPIDKFILYANRGGYGRPKGRSDLDAAYPHWKAKSSLLDAWRLHLEKFASPTLLGKYQRGLPAEEASNLLAALEGLAKRTAIVFPNEIEVGTLAGGRESNTNFMDAIEFHNREIARSVLGQTLTTDEGRRVGSLALGKVHLQVFLLQLQALRKELADVVMTEQVIRPLVELNFGPGDIPRFKFEEVPLEAFSTGTI